MQRPIPTPMNHLLHLAVAALLIPLPFAQAVTVGRLSCEYRENPVGVEVARPSLGWQLDTGRQTACQVVVEGLWDSGRVETDRSFGFRYDGPPPPPLRTLTWKVRVWDETGAASDWSPAATFTTGGGDWSAEWIGATDAAAGPVLGFAVESPDTNATKWVQVDLGTVLPLDRIVLIPQYHDDPAAGGWIHGYAFPLRFKVEVSDTPDFDLVTVVANHLAADFANPGATPVEFDARGLSGRFVRMTATRLWSRGKGLNAVFTLAEIEAHAGGVNAALGKAAAASDSYEGSGWGKAHLTDGRWAQSAPGPLQTHPHAAILLRKDFEISRPVNRAWVRMSGLGWSELSLNGARVGDAVLSPQFTDYDERVPYVMHDVTAALRAGTNTFGVILGNGFSATPGKGYLKWYGNGGPPRLLLQLDVEYADGTRRSVVSDGSWTWSTGAITFNDLWAGETIDARRDQPGWDAPGFAAKDWRLALRVAGPRGKLFARTIAPVRVLATESPVSVEGNLFHFELAGTGWLRLKTSGQPGDTVRVSYRPEAPTSTGWSATGWQMGTECILRGGGEEVFEPKFIFHTLNKTVRVDGLTTPAGKDTLTRRLVGIDLRRTGGFECSDPFLNAQYQALLRTQRNYNLDYPMDPTREKSGWTQDVMTMIHSATYDFDSAAFYWNWWRDMADNQRPDGYLGSVVPLVDRVLDDCNCVWWSGMIIYTPWQLYQYYGDTRFLEEAYPAMQAYLGWLAGKADADHVVSWGLGDWIEVGVNSAPKRTSVAITSTCGYYLYADLLRRTAEILGRPEDAARFGELAAAIKTGFLKRFFNPETGLVGAVEDSQTAHVLPLYLGMIPDEKRELVRRRLVANIHERKDHLSTGFIGTLHLLLGLPQLGEAGLAHTIVTQRDFPGWNTLVADGVQMETWNGGQVQMPSLGGPIGAYLYQVLAGIRPAEPGFRTVLIQPAVVGDLTWVKAHHDGPHGRIESEWRREGDRVTVSGRIPGNSRGLIVLPDGSRHDVAPGPFRFESSVPPPSPR